MAKDATTSSPIFPLPNDDIWIEDIVLGNRISFKAYKICFESNLDTLFSILDYYFEHKSFNNLRKCTSEINQELMDFCEQYELQTTFLLERNQKKSITELINGLPILFKDAFEAHVEFYISGLNARTKKSIHKIYRSRNLISFMEKIFEPDLSLNISHKQLMIFKSNVECLAHNMDFIKRNRFMKLHIKAIIKNRPIYYDFDKDVVLESFFDANDNLKFFKLLDYYIKDNYIGSEIYAACLYSKYMQNDEKYFSHKQIQKRTEYSKKFFEKILAKIPKRIFDVFLRKYMPVYKYLDNDMLRETASYIVIPRDIVERINDAFDLTFTTKLYQYIFRAYFQKMYTNLYIRNDNSRQNMFGTGILIKNVYYKSFDFKRFIEDLYQLKPLKLKHKRDILFIDFISNYRIVRDARNFNVIASICKEIIYLIFKINVDENNNFIEKSNYPKEKWEYVFEILQSNNAPMKIKDIPAAISKFYPEISLSVSQIRNYISRKKDLFIYLGGPSTYGLKKWEKEKDDIKGGTIRDMVSDFLMQQDAPKHISEILNYVIQYRKDTNLHSLESSLRSDTLNRFIFPGRCFFGLKAKTYQADKLNLYHEYGVIYFTKKTLRNMLGQDIKEVIDFYKNKYKDRVTEVDNYISHKIKKGELILSENNKLIGINYRDYPLKTKKAIRNQQ